MLTELNLVRAVIVLKITFSSLWSVVDGVAYVKNLTKEM